MTTATRQARLVLGVVASLVALATGPTAVAVAMPGATPNLQIVSPGDGSASNDQTPVFQGTTDLGVERDPEEVPEEEEVTLNIYRGTSASGKPVQKPAMTPFFFGGTWSLEPRKPLEPGVYTAQAEQYYYGLDVGLEKSKPVKSQSVTFTVDTTPPQVTLTSPGNGSTTSSGSQLISGSAGTERGDLPTITIRLFAGPTIRSQPPQETLAVPESNGSWSATFGDLSPGVYTARAEQGDEAGNTGTSAPVTFTVVSPPSPPLPAPPVASFKWFPAAPMTGQNISLVSTSTNTASPITAFAWALTSSDPFQAGNPVLGTSFSTPGGHVVRLRVTDAIGLSSVASETIEVTPRPLVLMQPFPIVRIAGSESSSGVHLSLLTVQAPVGTRVRVTCGGHHCPSRSESRVAVSSSGNSKVGGVLLTFRRFERSLQAGVILEIRALKPGEIGKYTSFEIRRNKPPVRIDSCVGPTNPRPIACPAS